MFFQLLFYPDWRSAPFKRIDTTEKQHWNRISFKFFEFTNAWWSASWHAEECFWKKNAISCLISETFDVSGVSRPQTSPWFWGSTDIMKVLLVVRFRLKSHQQSAGYCVRYKNRFQSSKLFFVNLFSSVCNKLVTLPITQQSDCYRFRCLLESFVVTYNDSQTINKRLHLFAYNI